MELNTKVSVVGTLSLTDCASPAMSLFSSVPPVECGPVHDPTYYVRRSTRTTHGIILLLLYIHDIIITRDDPQAISDLQHYLGEHIEMKNLGSLSYFLGLEVSLSSTSYSLSQVNYASDLLVRSGITDSATTPTPLDPNVCLTLFDGIPHEDVGLYRQLLDNSIYLTVTCLNIAYVVHIASYSDVDRAGYPTNRHFTSDYCFYLGDSLISWCNKKQSIVSHSSTKSEYYALVDATSELLWLRWLFADMSVL
ncbi:uncharacterized mitochondrial protein AtMg00810-like [Benincasa hispida]|uniref:uncharacterized mitochondrial protein AtMg00810-like n=1 Tax=Benincasa hispida TaxID=102211 RepID=UPI001901946E|nr:uncharacterized mitochondrial protein AtMg00810-like [Benincasa hispida]